MLSPDDVLELLAIKLIGIVPEDENVMVGSNKGQPVVLDPKSKAGRSFISIAKRLKGEEIAFDELTEKQDFISKLSRIFKPGGE